LARIKHQLPALVNLKFHAEAGCYVGGEAYVGYFVVQMIRLVAVVVVALSLGACGDYRFAPGPSPANPGVGYDVMVTEQDHTATVRVGQTLLLELHAKQGMTDWHDVKSSDTSVLAPMTIDVMVPRGVTLAAFKGVSQGQVRVGAIGGPLCSPAQPCPAILITYSLRVSVAPG
jgi:hypothetical protein